MTFLALTYAYHESNGEDKHQDAFLASAAIVGLVLALSLDVGILIGVFAIVTWLTALGLVVSDLFHALYMRRPSRSKWYRQEFIGDDKA